MICRYDSIDDYFEAQDDIRPTIIRCDICGEVIEDGEYVYELEGESICENCISDWLDDCRRQVSYE
jgi:formylmethanofuran dehydrogenase subunit E